MTQNLAVNFLSKTKNLEEYFMTTLSISKIMIDSKALSTLIGSYIFILSGGLIPTVALIARLNSWWLGISSMTSLLIGLSLLALSTWFSHSFAKRKYLDYASFITSKKIKLKYDSNFLFAYRCDKIRNKIFSLGFQDTDFDDLIEYYSRKSGNIKNKRWWPITLAGLILFPLWSEFIGKQIEKGLGAFLFMIIIAFVLTYFTSIFNSMLKTILLSKATKYDELVDILKTIKIL
ncbi:hypothetical protein [Paenibacillus polymyxa]|uniref:Uncharacterized protein n=1 Tax=Paenibacillus polymyxa TaxID=1406 RepID=A0AAE9IBU7_PAEPO|nr:hypothetical protein [Paenibacillus polymyxa]URJ50713.1 hypothetical protein MF626_000079 [Paenibacillus polymyxa]